MHRAVASAAAIVFCVGVLGALTVDRSEGEQQVRTAAPPTTTVVEELPVETTTTTTSTSAVPLPATAPAPPARPKPKPTTTTTQAAQKSGEYPGSVSFPFQAGRTSWAGTSYGTDLAVSIDTATPLSGVPVTFTLTVGHPQKKCCSYGFSTGDGGVYSDNGECADAVLGSSTWTITRAYNKAGRWKFTFTGITKECGGPPNEYPYMYGWIEVAPGGPATSQGPSLPTFKTFGRMGPTQYDNDHSHLAVIAQVTDTDGYVFKIVVDWGDGTSETFPEKDMGCRPSPSGWPQESFMKTPTDPAPVHHYQQQGTYKVTATAYSSGCDGRDVQQASSSFDWVY